MSWQIDDSRPIFIQLIEIVERKIIVGEYQPGQKLPSVREFASMAGVNPNTMQKALTELEKSQILETRSTNGRFVTADSALIDRMKHNLVLHYIDIYYSSMLELGIQRETAKILFNENNTEG